MVIHEANVKFSSVHAKQLAMNWTVLNRIWERYIRLALERKTVCVFAAKRVNLQCRVCTEESWKLLWMCAMMLIDVFVHIFSNENTSQLNAQMNSHYTNRHSHKDSLEYRSFLIVLHSAFVNSPMCVYFDSWEKK